MRPHRLVLLVVWLALAAVVSAVAALNVALPGIARDTGASQTQLSWIVDAYALTFAALLLPAGALGDRYGRRRVLLSGLLIFGAAASAAMFATGPAMLIVLRAVLGVGAALVMPATLSTITATFPPAQRVKGVATWTGVTGASAVLGLLASGLLLEVWSWRSVFALNVVLAAVAIAGTLAVVPESAHPQAAARDLGGTALSVAGLAVLVYALIEAPTAGWTSATTLVGLTAGLLLLAAFVAWELRQQAPLLDPRLFTHRAFAAGTVSLTVQFFAFFGFIFVFLQYLQLVRGNTPLVAALSMLPLAAGLIPASRLAPHLAARIGTGPVCTLALLLVSAALLALWSTDAATSYLLLAAALLPLGVGMGLAMTPATAAVTDALPEAEQGVASAVNDLSRELGGALGIAVLGSILNATYRAQLPLPGVALEQAERARESLAVASRVSEQIAAQARNAFVAGFHDALLVAAATVAVSAVVVGRLLLKGQTPDTSRAGHHESLPNDTQRTAHTNARV